MPGVTDPKVYHAPQKVKRGDPKFIMSSTELRSFAKCPDKWINDFKFEGSKSTEFGNLIDCWLLTPHLFNKTYVVSPQCYPANARSSAVVEGEANVGDDLPWDGKVTFCKNWKKEQDSELEIVSYADMVDCEFACKRILSKPTMKAFLEASDRQVMVVAEWHDKATGIIVPIKIMLDLVPRKDTEFFKCLGDFKSTRNAEHIAFTHDAFKMGYHVQLALYGDIYVAATGEDRCSFVWLLVENSHPFQPGKRIMTQNFYDIGRNSYQLMLANYCQCLKYNKWPDYDEHDEAVGDWSMVDATPFMAERAAFAPRFNFGSVPVEATQQDDDITP